MLFKLHYFCFAAGANALGILLGVYMDEYTDATPGEIGLLYMLMPFVGMTVRPIICSFADRQQAHRKYMINLELLTALSFAPFIIIPYLGPEFYQNHPRFCWYFLVIFKICGDSAFGGAVSIGDSLAINYSKRIGTEFSVYRIWGTISWMVFGFITGQVNEIWFLPKYVAAFMVLILMSLLDALACYLWPKEYFEMVTTSTMNKERQQFEREQAKAGAKLTSSMTRSLMPREVVWAHAKRQLWRLATLSCMRNDDEDTQQVEAANQRGHPTRCGAISDRNKKAEDDEKIDKMTQLKTLALLMRRDPRIVLYLSMFVFAGASLMPLSFFFMSLSEICHTQNTCDFSKLGGYLQVSMALVESLLFLHIKTVVKTIGRLNMLSLAFLLAAAKYWFYATIWTSVDPHWSLLSESITGIVYATFLTLMVEMGHLFATEVEHLIPELVERGVVKTDSESGREKLKLSLSATMQALISSANDGLGRGVSALFFGLIIGAYSYETLWLVIAAVMTFMVGAVQFTSLIEHCFKLEFGLKENKPSGEQSQDNILATIENGPRFDKDTHELSKGDSKIPGGQPPLPQAG